MKKIPRVLALLALTCVWGAILSCSNNSDGGSVTYKTVTFNSDGGSEVEAKKVLAGSKVEKPADPTKTGYDFKGWFKGSDAFDFGSAVNEDITLTARWAAKTFKVTFITGTGASDPDPATATATYGQKLADLANIPTKLGATFGGYYTEQLGGGTKFIDKDGKGCAEWTLTSDTTLYAVFGVAITYQNTKNVASNNPDVYIVGKGVATLSALDGTSIGYTFNGWSKTDGGAPIDTSVPAIPTTEDTPQTFYALWTPISYSITYEGLAGATNPNAASYTVESADIVLQNVANCYQFDGWFDAATGGNKITSIPQGSMGPKTLYARGVLLGTKAKPDTLGDIVFNNGRAAAYSDGLVLDDNAKGKAVAVIFYTGSPEENGLGVKILGVGLKKGANLAWAPSTSPGYNIKFSTSDIDGSGNWAVIQAVGSSGAGYAATNYPAFNFCNTYGDAVPGSPTGWYLPAVSELFALQMPAIVTAVDNSIGKIGESANVSKLGSDWVWSSSQGNSAPNAKYVNLGTDSYNQMSKDRSSGDAAIRAVCQFN